jgi:hypothetical protein
MVMFYFFGDHESWDIVSKENDEHPPRDQNVWSPGR